MSNVSEHEEVRLSCASSLFVLSKMRSCIFSLYSMINIGRNKLQDYFTIAFSKRVSLVVIQSFEILRCRSLHSVWTLNRKYQHKFNSWNSAWIITWRGRSRIVVAGTRSFLIRLRRAGISLCSLLFFLLSFFLVLCLIMRKKGFKVSAIGKRNNNRLKHSVDYFNQYLNYILHFLFFSPSPLHLIKIKRI